MIYVIYNDIVITLMIIPTPLVNNSCINDDPIVFIEQDKVLKSLFVFYVLVLICVLTLLK